MSERKSRITWGDFFSRVEELCEFKDDTDKDKGLTWMCDHDHRRCVQACGELGGDWDIIGTMLMQSGGYCDCEVIFNSTEYIDEDELLPLGEIREG